jgi:hypothetical protein
VEQSPAVQARHADIGQQQVWRLKAHHVQGFEAVGGRAHLVSGVAERGRQQEAYVRVVVDDHQPNHLESGTVAAAGSARPTNSMKN